MQAGCCSVLAILAFLAGPRTPPEEPQPISDMTAKYHFLGASDVLAILDEEGRLKGYIEVAQPEEESEDILTYEIVDGTRQQNQVKFRTVRIHGKFYRFAGFVERGKGGGERDPDYLRLTGTLDVVSVDGTTGKESVQSMHVALKSWGKSEEPPD